MPSAHLVDVISKALKDKAYRAQLLDDPETATQDYELDDNELRMLRNLQKDAFDELDTDVETRQSKSGLSMGFGSLMGGRDVSSGDVSGLINILMNKYG